MSKKRKQSELPALRRRWKEQVKGKDKEQVIDLLYKKYNKVFLYSINGKERFVQVDEISEKPLGYDIIDPVTQKKRRLPPWYLLNAVEIPEREIVEVKESNEAELVQRAYSIIWKSWKKYLDIEIKENKLLGIAVKIARENITLELCPWYPKTQAYKIWEAALIDLSRKMHDGYVPVTSSGEELWDAKL